MATRAGKTPDRSSQTLSVEQKFKAFGERAEKPFHPEGGGEDQLTLAVRERKRKKASACRGGSGNHPMLRRRKARGLLPLEEGQDH